MSQITDVKKFLKAFNPGTVAIKNTTLHSNGKTNMVKDTIDNVLYWNARQHDAYFVVNPGGSLEKDINKLVACFVDLDAGRDSKGKYFSGATLKTRKLKMLNALSMFPLAPSYIVETRNGFQIYWLLKNHSKTAHRLNRWNTVQQTIHQFFAKFGADKRVVKCNQIMRLPHTDWHKKWEKKPAYAVTIRSSHPSRKYKLEDFKYELRLEAPTGGFVTATTGTGDWSYNRVAKVVGKHTKNKVQSTAQSYGGPIPKDADQGVLIEVIGFLKDVNFFLYGKGSRFMARQATTLANKLTSEFGVS